MPRKSIPPIQTSLSKKLKKRARNELWFAIFAVALLTLSTVIFEMEIVEALYDFTREYENWDLDELLLFFLWFGLVGIIYATRRVQDIQQLNNEVASLAFNDPITDLPNRALSMDRLRHMLDRAQRYKSKVAVVFIDFDDFKMVNDTYGHDKGDLLIHLVGERLRKSVRANDTVGRLGGDEFLLLIEFVEDKELEEIQQRINALQNASYLLGLTQVNMSFSMGVAVFPKDGTNATELLKAADTAMYTTKQTGKGSINFYSADMGAKLANRYAMESGLKMAIEKNQLYLEYQPQMCLITGKLSGYEALLRWKKDGINISPYEFIAIAEESGHIEKIGIWVLLQAVAEMKDVLNDGQMLAINVSPRQFRQTNLVAEVKQLLASSQLPAEKLELEITESAIASDFEGTLHKIAELRALGVSIAIDDFGTGYSSLGRLRDLHVNRIKVDKSFVARMADSSKDDKLVESILVLARNMGVRVVAEGVETQMQLARLRTLECDFIQGYYYGRPLPANAYHASHAKEIKMAKSCALKAKPQA